MKVLLVAVLLCLATRAGFAEEANGSAAPPIYVGEFQPVEQPSSGFGPLHALTSGLHDRSVDKEATALSLAVVRALQNRQIAAQKLAPDGPLPASGWLVRGVFYSLDSGGHLLSLPFLNSHKSPNVEVSVTIADCAKDPATPFAVIGTDAVIKGRGAPIGWNPYVIGARLVIKDVERTNSLDDLAAQIAQKISENWTDLAHQDAGR